IWGRWVTTMTGGREPRALRRRPTCTAASPPMPASTSSKTRVGSLSASAPTVLIASITRASSPPDATRASGCSGSPGVAEDIISPPSAPVAPLSVAGPSPTSPCAFRLRRCPRALQLLCRAELQLEAAPLFDPGPQRSAVFAFDSVEHREARFDGLQPAWIGVQQFGVSPKLQDDVSRLLRQQLQACRLLAQPRIELGRGTDGDGGS